jgi:3-hydroxy acid dehydrogenase / malonic semialdehyde reductase
MNSSNFLILSTGILVGATLNSLFKRSRSSSTTMSPSSPRKNVTNSSIVATPSTRPNTNNNNNNTSTPTSTPASTPAFNIHTGSSSTRLDGKVVVVIGAKSRVGLAVARAVHAAGARVIMADAPRLEALKKVCQTLNDDNGDSPASRIHAPPKTAAVFLVDITDAANVKRLCTKAIDTFGSVDIVINVAGHQQRTDMKDLKEKVWSKTMEVNCNGLLHVFGAFLPSMISNHAGHVISVSSVAARQFFPRLTLYGASKQWVETVSTGTNNELAKHGVRVTTVQAGDCTEELNGIGNEGSTQEFSELNPADVAHAVMYAATSGREVKSVQVVAAD